MNRLYGRVAAVCGACLLLAALSGCGPFRLLFTRDGKRFVTTWAFRKNAESILLVSLDSPQFESIFTEIVRWGEPGHDEPAAISPDGRSIVMCRSGKKEADSRIDFIDVRTHKRRTFARDYLSAVTFSPDGALLGGYWHTNDVPDDWQERKMVIDEFRIYRVADGKLVSRAPLPSSGPSMPVWLPGHCVAAVCGSNLLRIDGNRVETISTGLSAMEIKSTRDGKLIRTADVLNNPPRIRILKLLVPSLKPAGKPIDIRVHVPLPDRRFLLSSLTYVTISPDGRRAALIADLTIPTYRPGWVHGYATAAYVMPIREGATPKLLEVGEVQPPKLVPKLDQRSQDALTDHDTEIPTPNWTPDGRLAVVSGAFGNADLVAPMNVYAPDGTHRRSVPFLRSHAPALTRLMREETREETKRPKQNPGTQAR
jgi:hypothetical protein